MDRKFVSRLAVYFLCSTASTAYADLLGDIGYTGLASLLGSSLATGEQAIVDQTEASTAPNGELAIYLANGSLASFPNTQIVDQSGINSSVFSAHATSVAQRIGGVAVSQLPDLMQIDAYEAVDWINSILRALTEEYPVTGTGQVANHSWVGDAKDEDGDNTLNVDILRRLDWLVAADNYFHAIGASTASKSILFGHAMNGVVVKNTASTTNMSTLALDNIYTAGRAAVHVVAPESSPSNATGVVSSSAMLLKQLFANESLPPELLKAVLMAGAARETNNSQSGDIQNYGAVPSNNGLDYRYGAGQLNVLNSYRILAAGKQSAGSVVSAHGYDLEENFGAPGQTNAYLIVSDSNGGKLLVGLVWNLNINTSPTEFNPSPILYDLNLELYDVTGGRESLVMASASTIDNTENLWVDLLPHRDYEIRVSHQHPGAFSWPYALAWRFTQNVGAEPQQIPILPFPALASLLILIAWLNFRRP